jgi:hypothetical protein
VKGGRALGLDTLWFSLFGPDGGGLDQSTFGRRSHHGLLCLGQQHQTEGRAVAVFAHADRGRWGMRVTGLALSAVLA